MKPGASVTCSSCQAVAVAWSTSPASWREGDPLIATFVNGPHPRHLAFSREAPELCPWCDEKARGWPSLQGRPLASEAPWTAGGPGCTFEIPPICRGAGEGPSSGRNPGTPSPRAAAAPEAPLERPASGQLGLAL